jgi:hypothetical protein
VQIEATLTRSDIKALFERLAPLTVRLGGDDELTLDGPIKVKFDPSAGVRFSCRAKVRWSVLGLHVPVTVRAVGVCVVPVLERNTKGVELLAFKVALSGADIAVLPDALDAKVTERINAELVKNRVQVAWDFRAILDHVFGLPDRVETATAIGLKVRAAEVRMTTETLSLSVQLDTSVARRAAGSSRHARAS